ncbi:MAG: hypothetical protein WC044_06110 [Crocinitomicaceae bacterium]
MVVSEPNVIVFDGICGSGKTTRAFELINELTTIPHYGSRMDPKFIFVTPFTMECHRIAGSIPIEIPREHANDYDGYDISELSERDANKEQRRDSDGNVIYRERKETDRFFVLPVKLSGGRLAGIKEAIYHNQDIVITHSAFLRFDIELLNLIKQRDYQLIIDETPNLFGSITDLADDITSNDIRNLQKIGNITSDENDIVSWNITESAERWDVYEKLKYYIDQKRVVQYSDDASIFFLRFIPEYFTAFRSIHLLTYIFEGSICKSYFDLYNISYSVTKIIRNHGDPAEYWNLIEIPRNNSSEIQTLRMNSLSSTWYKGKTATQVSFIKKATESFFNNTCRGIDADKKLWTVYLDQINKVKGKGYTKQFLSLTSRATNIYKDVEAVAYLLNLYPYTPISNYFAAKRFPVNNDKYALAEMLQWIFRSRIRKGESIKLFLPSPRMKKLLVDWMEELKTENSSSTTTN